MELNSLIRDLLCYHRMVQLEYHFLVENNNLTQPMIIFLNYIINE
jgi:hypothetical protein